jgi:REP element-mobilizing transposase RayT
MGQASRLKTASEFSVYRRNLPHYELPGSVYFITFRTAKGFRLSDQARDITLESVRFHAGKKYELYACVVMDTHAHTILQPIETQARRPVPPAILPSSDTRVTYHSLAQVTHSIKSYSANRIQRDLHWNGSVWLDENYDRVVRNDDDFVQKMNYIIYNPVKNGLVEKPEDYRWLYVAGALSVQPTEQNA